MGDLSVPIPTDRDSFKDFCLRALGAPVLQINVDDTQVEDRVDQAIYKWQQFHMDAVVKTYLKHEVTASLMTFTGPPTVPFANGEQLVGSTSNNHGWTSTPVFAGANSIFMFSTDEAGFTDGEVITGKTSGAVATLGTSNASFTAVVKGDMDNKWIPIPSNVISITKIFLPNDMGFSLGGDILFDPMSQFNMSMMSNFSNDGMTPYVIGRQYQQLVMDLFRGRPQIRWGRHENKLHIDVNWNRTFAPHHFIIVDCYTALDPVASPDVWSDMWLQNYAIALIKKQWGINMSKFSGITLPGGVMLDGKTMVADANVEIKDLEQQLVSMYQLPIDFTVG